VSSGESSREGLKVQQLNDLCHTKDLVATVVQLEACLRKEVGINLNQAFVLCCLARVPLSAGAIADELRIHGASLSRIIKVLHSKGYIYRNLDSRDSRQKVLALTEEGKRKALLLAEYEAREFPLTVVGRELVEKR